MITNPEIVLRALRKQNRARLAIEWLTLDRWGESRLINYNTGEEREVAPEVVWDLLIAGCIRAVERTDHCSAV